MMDTSGLDDLIRQMNRMGQITGPAAREMVEAGSKVIEDAWKASAGSHGHVRTGAMVNSTRSDATRGLGGTAVFRDIYPHGKDGKGVRNAEKAFILQYGRSYGRTQKPGDYWVEEAEKDSEAAVVAVCQEIWDKYLASAGK